MSKVIIGKSASKGVKHPKPARKFVGAYIDESMYDRLKARALAEDRPVNWLVARMVREFLAEGDKHPAAQGAVH